MKLVTVIYIIVIAILVVLSGLFSCADITYSVVNRLRLEKAAKKSKTAKKAYQYALNYDKTIATILFSNNFVNIVASSLATLLAAQLCQMGFMGGDDGLSKTVMSMILLVVILIFGEILPKAIGRVYSYSLSLMFVPLVEVCRVVFFPVVWLTSKIANGIASPFTKGAKDELPSDEELQRMVEDIESEGIIDETDRELISASIEFKETAAYEIMTPRMRLVCINKNEDLASFAKMHPERMTHSRLLIYNHDYDHILGYIPTKTVLKALANNANPSIESLLMPIISVPRTMEISGVLRLMKRSHHHIALVRDEYGGTEGILTLEDILEELVGELYDESESVKEDVVEMRKNVFLVQGSMNIDDFFERFNLNDDLIDEDYNTLSGWINDKLGGFADRNDKFSYEKIDLKVKKATEYTVEEVEVVYHPRRKKTPHA
ncbi:MAG: hemolysin family protein [Bacilli bacterium]|nr:hemolysin family protein [Bacilli bacterium]